MRQEQHFITHDFMKYQLSIKQLPIWAFHGAKDDIVPVEETRKIIDTLREYGSTVRYTEYPDAGQDSWTETYNNREVYEWLLSQRRLAPS